MSACRQGSGHAPGVRRFAGFSCWRSFRILAFGILFLVAVSAAADSAGPGQQTTTSVPMRFGLLPFSSPVSLFQRFGPLETTWPNRCARHSRLRARATSPCTYSASRPATTTWCSRRHISCSSPWTRAITIWWPATERIVRHLPGRHGDPAQGLENLAGRDNRHTAPGGADHHGRAGTPAGTSRSRRCTPEVRRLPQPQRRHTRRHQRACGGRHRLDQRGPQPRSTGIPPCASWPSRSASPALGVLVHERVPPNCASASPRS
jgi:hypothetical protein